MAGTLLVLVMLPIVSLLASLTFLAACSRQARRNGQHVKSMSWSPRHGFSAKFYKD